MTTLTDHVIHDAMLDGLLDGLVEAVQAGDDPDLVQIMRENVLNYFATTKRSERQAVDDIETLRANLSDWLSHIPIRRY